jgi:hypothetical protein
MFKTDLLYNYIKSVAEGGEKFNMDTLLAHYEDEKERREGLLSVWGRPRVCCDPESNEIIRTCTVNTAARILGVSAATINRRRRELQAEGVVMCPRRRTLD